MRINTNVAALNAQRNYANVSSRVTDSITKLSSGFRINRAADDAAGLGIANKFRADVRGLSQAAKNAEQATSVLQIAEGSVNTVSQIVERMKELATQAASDNVDADGRARLQAEFSKLQAEISRTVDTTSFQGQKLLNGSFGSKVDKDVTVSTILAAASIVGDLDSKGAKAGTYTMAHTANTLTLTDVATGSTEVIDVTGRNGRQTFSFAKYGISVETEVGFTAATPVATQFDGNIVVVGGQGSFLVGSSGDYNGSDAIQLDSLDVSLTTLGLTASDISTRDNARTALTSVDSAISSVSSVLGKIGAAQNTLDFALQSTKTAMTNFTAAESVIRDLDMAEEFAKFSKNQIISQAAQSMLAQANQGPQGILQLLRG